jgi:predicted PolB exonuclease-like 3'-5' exonuclease
MGFNDENSQRVVFDIETAALPEAAEFLEPAEAPGNYKDPAKIAENLDRCALDVDLCRVVAIGWQVEGQDHRVMLADSPEAEKSAINTFWSFAAHRHLVCFNGLSFDLPVLFRRAQYLGASVPSIGINKYRHPSVTDLQMVLSFDGAIKLRGLSFYCRRFGIDIPDTMTGADIAQAVADGRWEDVQSHVTADIQKTAALAARLGFFRPVAELAVL